MIAERFLLLSRIRLVLLPVVILLIVAGCSISKPKAPTWDTDFTIPLASHTYDMREIVDRLNEDALTCDSAGKLWLGFKGKIDPVRVDVGLTLGDTVESSRHLLGNVNIVPPRIKDIILGPQDYITPHPDIGKVGPFEIHPSVSIDSLETFQFATFVEGKMTLKVTNNTDFDFSSISITVMDTVMNDYSGAEVAVFDFPTGLRHRESAVDTAEIVGRTFGNRLSLRTVLNSPGGKYSGGSNENLELQFAFLGQPKVSIGLAEVDTTKKTFLGKVEINYRHRLDSGLVNAGLIDIKVVNGTTLTAGAQITVNEFRLHGSRLTFGDTLAPAETLHYKKNIRDYTFIPDNSGSMMGVNVRLDVSVPHASSQLMRIDPTHQYSVTAELTGVHFAQVTGPLAPTEIVLDTATLFLYPPKGMEGISLPEAFAILSVHIETDLPVVTDLTIDGSNQHSVVTHDSIADGPCVRARERQFLITNLQRLFAPFPEKITIVGTATVGDDKTPGTICELSSLWGEVEIKSPLRMALDATDFTGDTNTVHIDQQHIDEISNRLKSGKMYTTVTNHLPLGAKVRLYLAGDLTDLYSSAKTGVVIDSFVVAAAPVDMHGKVTNSAVSSFVTELSEQELKIIRNPTIYVGSKVHFNGTYGDAVSVLDTDYLGIQSFIKLTTRMGGVD